MWSAFLGCASTLCIAGTPKNPAPLPVYLEDSPAAQELVEQARELHDQGRLTEAVDLLQKVIDEYPRKLMPSEDGLFVDAVLWTRRMLLSEEAWLAAYRKRFEPSAQRAVDMALSPPFQTAGLEETLARFALTRSGLEAGLALASLYLERADAWSACSVLDELQDHPDLDEQRQRYHHLAAIAGLFTLDEQRMTAHRNRLVEEGFVESVEALDALSSRLYPPLHIQSLHGQRPNQTTCLVLPDATEHWEVSLSFAPSEAAAMRFGALGLRAHIMNRGDKAYPMLPAADADRVYINDGDHIHAIQRYSRRPLWRFDAGAAGKSGPYPPHLGFGMLLPDRRGVLLHGERLYAVVGPAAVWTRRQGRNLSDTALVCLERTSGQLRWRVKPQDLDPTFSKAHFQGTPRSEAGRVFAILRRNQLSGFQDAFIVAIDSGTGRLLWRRHLSSAATGGRRYVSPPPVGMAVHGGRLYVCDNVGAAAAIDSRSGSILWVRVLTDGKPNRKRHAVPHGQLADTDFGGPVLVRAGLVIPATASGKALLLDQDTGRLVRELLNKQWTSARYLLPAGQDILVIGPSASLVDGSSLEWKWEFRLERDEMLQPACQASVTRHLAVVPTLRRLILLRLHDGSLALEIPVQESGNVLAQDEQLILATPRKIRCYMAWDRAYEALKNQSHRADPAAGLSLAYLALTSDGQRVQANREQVLVEGADLAIAALRQSTAAGVRTDDIRQQVFDELLGFADPARGASVDVRRALFDRLATITATPNQEAAYHLSLGQLLEQLGAAAEAVEHYQSVLLDRALSSGLVRLSKLREVYRQAGLEAKQRLTRLVKTEGRKVYKRFDAIAYQSLADLIGLREVDPAELIEVARQYPVSGAAARARLEAAKILSENGDQGAAISQLRRAYRQTHERDQLAKTVGRISEFYEHGGRPDRALRWLRRVKREHADLQPLRQDVPVLIDSWIGELALLRLSADALPSLTIPLGDPFLLEGRLITPPTTPPSAWPQDRVLIQTGSKVRLLEGPALTKRWEAPFPSMPGTGPVEVEDVPAEEPQADPHIEPLVLTEGQVLLWSPQSAWIAAFDGATGEASWPAIDAKALLEPLGKAQTPGSVRTVEQRQFLALIGDRAQLAPRGLQHQTRFFSAVSENVLCIADVIGRLVGIDRHSGDVLWRKRCPIEHVTALVAGEETLAIGGTNGINSNTSVGAVLVLDPLTGEEILPVIEDRNRPQWIGFGDGSLIIAAADQLSARHLSTGEVAWRTIVGINPKTPLQTLGMSPDSILTLMHGGWLMAVDPQSGQIHDRLSTGSVSPKPRIQSIAIEGQWQILTQNSAFALSDHGQLIWRDSISSVHKNFVLQLVGDQYVALLAEESPSAPDAFVLPPQQLGRPMIGGQPELLQIRRHQASSSRYRLYLLDRRGGSVLVEYKLGPVPQAVDPEAGIFQTNRLVLSVGPHTLVLPGAAGEGSE